MTTRGKKRSASNSKGSPAEVERRFLDQLELGQYVEARKRANGTYAVRFKLSPAMTPKDWPSVWPLPRTGNWPGNLLDPQEVQAIRDDAAALRVEVQMARATQKVDENQALQPRTWETLRDRWEADPEFKRLDDTTKHGYRANVRRAIRLATEDNVRPSTASELEITTALNRVTHPVTRTATLHAFRVMLRDAKRLGWRKDNPTEDIKIKGRAKASQQSRVGIWEADDVAFYARKAEEAGLVSLAGIIQTEWEIGQRLTDVRLFRYAKDKKDREGQYLRSDGVFRFWQNKTQQWVTIPVSDRLMGLLNRPGGSLLFPHPTTGEAYTSDQLTKEFNGLRKLVGRNRRFLEMKHLRHSCVVQLATAEPVPCEILEIAAITGHTVASVNTIIQRYCPRDNRLAWAAQRKRGLVRSEPAVAQ
jgi:hypothetical protein